MPRELWAELGSFLVEVAGFENIVGLSAEDIILEDMIEVVDDI